MASRGVFLDLPCKWQPHGSRGPSWRLQEGILWPLRCGVGGRGPVQQRSGEGLPSGWPVRLLFLPEVMFQQPRLFQAFLLGQRKLLALLLLALSLQLAIRGAGRLEAYNTHRSCGVVEA